MFSLSLILVSAAGWNLIYLGLVQVTRAVVDSQEQWPRHVQKATFHSTPPHLALSDSSSEMFAEPGVR